jgi:hypothetical protein
MKISSYIVVVQSKSPCEQRLLESSDREMCFEKQAVWKPSTKPKKKHQKILRVGIEPTTFSV